MLFSQGTNGNKQTFTAMLYWETDRMQQKLYVIKLVYQLQLLIGGLNYVAMQVLSIFYSNASEMNQI